MRPQTIIIIVLVLALLFGASKLPSLARNLGQSMRIFKSEVEEMRGEDERRHEHEGSRAVDDARRDDRYDRRSDDRYERRYDDDRRYDDERRYDDRRSDDRAYDPREERDTVRHDEDRYRRD